MFFTTIIGSGSSVDRADRAARWHGSRLAATGWSGDVDVHRSLHALSAWDRESTHSSVVRDGGSLTITAGYVSSGVLWPVNDSASGAAPEGEFACVRLLQSEGSISLDAMTDRAGSWPLYWGFDDDQVIVSTDPHYVAIALKVTEIDDQTAYELAAYHHSLSTASTFPGVHRLAPGRRLHAIRTAEGLISVRVEQAHRYRYRPRTSSQDHVIDRAWSALREGVLGNAALRTGIDDATIQISGGLDSRLTLGVIADAFSSRPTAMTLDLSNPAEARIASDVSSRLGFPHELAVLDSLDIDSLRNGWLLTGGQVSPYAAAGNLLSYAIAKRDSNGSVLLVGGWPGDCLIGSYIPRQPGAVSPLTRTPFTASWRKKRAPRWPQRGIVFSGPLAKHYRRSSDRRLRAAIADGSGSTAAQRISYWAMFCRQPAFSYLSPAILTARVLAVTPLLSSAYLDELLTLRAEDIYAKNFYRRLLVRCLPALSDIPYAATGSPIDERQLRPPRAPRDIAEAYTWLPAWVQNALHEVIGRRRSGGIAPEDDAEKAHWRRVLDAEEVSGRIELSGAVLDARDSADVHVRSIELALKWSRKYLLEARAEIAD